MNIMFSLIAAGVLLAASMSWLYLRERQRRLTLSSELERTSKQMEAGVVRDKLTGLLTPSGFSPVLDHWVQKVDRNGGSFCLLYIALDDFGMINDAFGHTIGDSMLMEVSHGMAAFTASGSGSGSGSEACHISAGKFALIVNGGIVMGRIAAGQLKNVLKQAIKSNLIQTQMVHSIGIVVYPDHGPQTMLLGNAALAMRSLRSEGGGGFCEYDHSMGLEIRERTLLVNDLRRALELGQFKLYFQPKIDAEILQITALEALLRWEHPTRGYVSPVVFIPLAEQYGLIGSIGNWVIEEACRNASRWRKRGLRIRVAVNISGHQMHEDDLVDRIQAALQRHGIQPGRFTCEITESVAMEDTKLTRQTFDKMRDAGIHVSIDDFGTGYSSLSALRQLPATELKIDRSFVVDLEGDESARLIVKTIINMATALGLRTVAEGVETIGQRDLLVSMGCNELQGFLFSAPISADDIEYQAFDYHHTNNTDFRPSLFLDTVPAELT